MCVCVCVKGSSGRVGKMIISAGVQQLAIVAYSMYAVYMYMYYVCAIYEHACVYAYMYIMCSHAYRYRYRYR